MPELEQKLNNAVLSKKARIHVAGHRGMVGSALVRALRVQGFGNIITKIHAELDLTNQQEVNDFFQTEKIDAVFLAAAKVGGIHANNLNPADFIYQNLMIQCNVIHAAFKAGIERMLFLGSSCIYPKDCPQPMKEEYLLDGYLEPTNEPYAVAKIAGIKLCESYNRQHGTKYRSVMPTNLYGPNDNFDLKSSHVLPAMIRKFHLAKLAMTEDFDLIKRDEELFGPIPKEIWDSIRGESEDLKSPSPAVRLWGTGAPRREFLHVDDMADACLFIMQMTDDDYHKICSSRVVNQDDWNKTVSHINVGCGIDITIRQLAEEIRAVSDFKGDVIWDTTMPDGMKQKLLDLSRLTPAGWKPKIKLKEGIQQTYEWYKETEI